MIETTEAPVDSSVVFAELKHVIASAIDDHPRSQQTAIGASEIGVACERRLGYKLLQVPEINKQPPAWRPTVGTAVHAWLQDAFDADNINSGYLDDFDPESGRWLTERRFVVGAIGGGPVWGTCDLFDVATGTSVDWKIVGRTTLRNAKAGRIDAPYKYQGQIYGRGWAAKGLTVHTVMVVFLPSSGELSEAQFWAEPYDPAKAEEAFARAQRVDTLLGMFGDKLIPTLPTADSHCAHCPWFRLNSPGDITGCPGVEELQHRHPARDSISDLLVPELRKAPA